MKCSRDDRAKRIWGRPADVFEAHGEACEVQRSEASPTGRRSGFGTPRGGIADWDETISLVTAMAYAYLKAHPAVAMTSDGRLGWTRSAKVKREAEAGEAVEALSGDLEEARSEVTENL